MVVGPDAYVAPLREAHEAALRWLASLPDRPVPARAGVDEVVAALGPDLPDGPTDAAEVVRLLDTACEPGLTAMQSSRFFGFVIGGTTPAAMAADWLVSAWDQNSGLRVPTPASTAVEDVTSAWLLDLLGLPAGSAVGYVTGATMASFTCLAAARDAVLRDAGWDVTTRGLVGAPTVPVVVGAERHDAVDLALRYLGLGAPVVVEADDEGRMRADALRGTLDSVAGGQATSATARPIVVVQAGNVHSGAFDPFEELVDVARDHDAWVHVDGAFGLWAAASPRLRHLVAGSEHADSWATDAHKTLNVPYDSGLAIVRDRAALRAAMGVHAAYLIHDAAGDPMDYVPELSRRARAAPIWAVLRSLGRSGVAALVEGLCDRAQSFAAGLAGVDGARVLNDVVFTQVCVSFGDDGRTRAVVDGMLADGTAWMTGSRWHDQAVVRIAVSNWSTQEDDVRRSLAALERVVAGLRG